jgi:hypothetical protein
MPAAVYRFGALAFDPARQSRCFAAFDFMLISGGFALTSNAFVEPPAGTPRCSRHGGRMRSSRLGGGRFALA